MGRNFQLFEDVGGEITMKDDDIITFLTDGYPGACEEEPMAVLYSKKETKSQPKAPVSQPTAAVSQPTAAVSQPTAAVSQPTAAVSQPTAAVSQPTAAVSPRPPGFSKRIAATKDGELSIVEIFQYLI